MTAGRTRAARALATTALLLLPSACTAAVRPAPRSAEHAVTTVPAAAPVAATASGSMAAWPCRLLTADLAATVLAPRQPSLTADVASVCAYTASPGSTLVNIGAMSLGRSQTPTTVLADEMAQQQRSGYRASRVTVGKRYPAVLEDGRPYVARLVWVQRGRALALTVSPAASASTTRLQQVARAISTHLSR